MSDRQQLRDLTPPDAPQWKVVGLELAHRCTFCGGPSEATLGCPDETAPLVFQVGVCNNCLVDCVMRRFREVKHQRIAQLAGDITAAAHAVRDARKKARWERYERNFPGKEPDPVVEAEAARRLAGEEEGIARKFDMCPGWSYDEHQKDYRQTWRERRGRKQSAPPAAWLNRSAPQRIAHRHLPAARASPTSEPGMVLLIADSQFDPRALSTRNQTPPLKIQPSLVLVPLFLFCFYWGK